MVDFDVFIGMDWFSYYYSMVDFRANVARFHFLGDPILVLKANAMMPSGMLIYYLQAHKILDKGCLYHLVHVRDLEAEKQVATLQSVSVVNEYPDVFPVELLGQPLIRVIDYGIEVDPAIKPIIIQSYRMAPSELKEIKQHMKDLLDKGFIHPSISPQVAQVLFVRKKDGTMWMCTYR